MKLLNKVKISLLIAFFIILLSGIKVFAVTGVITEITVNLREKPSTDSKKIMYVTQDDVVEVLEKDGEWYKIKAKGKIGYVFGEYLKVDDSKLEPKEEETATTQPEENVSEKEEENENQEPIQDVTTDAELKLQIKSKTDIRLIPNISSSVIYTSKKDIYVNVIEQLNDWSYILVDNVYGWVRTDKIVEEKQLQQDVSKGIDEDSNKQEIKIAYVKYESVNLRQKASTSSTVLAKLKLNNEVIVLEKVNSTWSKVEYDGITGYVSTDLLADEKQKEEEKDTTTTSRNGESTSRNETSTDEKEKTTSNKNEEVINDSKVETTESTNKTETTVKENSTSNKEENKEATTNSENKKEETTTNSESKKEETTSSKVTGEDIVAYAKKYLGYDYVYGGTSPKTGFDCSGFTYYVYKHFGYTLSRTSTLQAKNGKEVAKSDLQPGDLLIFKNQSLTAIGHVGIYIGNNKMIHSSEPGVGVVITSLDASGYYYNKRYVTARRII